MTRNENRQIEEARAQAAAYESLYGNLNEAELKTTIINLLNELDGLVSDRKLQMDAAKEVIDNRKDAVKYCRDRIDFVRGGVLEQQGTLLLEEDN